MCDAGSTDKWASIAWMLLFLVDPTFGRALNINSKPAGGAAAPGAAASSLSRLRHRRDLVPAATQPASDHARGSGRPLPLRVSASLLSRVLGAASCWIHRTGGASKAAAASLPSSSQGRDSSGGRAGCPTATQPEPITVSPFFIRLSAGNWQAALWNWTERDGTRLAFGTRL
jgi:hypothetical protein